MVLSRSCFRENRWFDNRHDRRTETRTILFMKPSRKTPTRKSGANRGEIARKQHKHDADFAQFRQIRVKMNESSTKFLYPTRRFALRILLVLTDWHNLLSRYPASQFAMNPISKAETDKAIERIQELRQQSLIATRKGDFRRVARLTLETVRMNQQLQNQTKAVFS